MSRFSVLERGRLWTVMDGHMPVATYTEHWKADERADRLERLARRKRRACLTCGSEFTSEGPHNRMCAPCRQNSQ